MTLTTPTELTTKAQAIRAVNQLLSVIVGQAMARSTDYLKDEPLERVKACLDLTMDAYKVAMTAGDTNGIKQLQRKTDSLGSLAIMANLLTEFDFD